MNISEIFYSIQGEGKRTGFPSFFIRTNFCNLRCKFPSGNLCDTPYTSWNPQGYKLSINEIINEYEKYKVSDVVITGGEPTIQTKELTELSKMFKLLYDDIYVTLETNGTVFGDFIYDVDLVSISPKLSSSIPKGTEFEKVHKNNHINFDVLKRYHKDSDEIQWKFVVSSEEDIEEILYLQKEIGFKNENIFLMPEGITSEELTKKRPLIIELCKQYKMNFTDRLQIHIWGNKRGV